MTLPATDIPVKAARPRSTMWPLEKARPVIIVAGCLAAAYTQLSMSVATTAFVQSLGGTGTHIGILEALPVGLLFVQFLAGFAMARWPRRKAIFLPVTIAQRLTLVPVALGPWLFPQVESSVWLLLFLVATGINHLLIQFTTPLWLSWMGDYLPHATLNEFWGLRQRWMQYTSVLALLLVAGVFLRSGLSTGAAFSLLLCVGAVFGVVDILLFVKIEEPPPHVSPRARLRDLLQGPFLQRDYRSFILFSSFWHLSTMIGAPFISLFLLESIGMSLFDVLMLWACFWTGGAMSSRQLGIWSERFGQRPILILCVAFKSINMIAFLLIPPEPVLAFWVLVPVFMLDAVLNTGILIANNGFMLKNSPRENRTMFIAAGSAYAGIVGGLTSIVAGICLTAMKGRTWEFAGATWNNYHMIFAVSLLFRLASVLVARTLHEPSSTPARRVALHLIEATPLRLLLPPLETILGLDDED